MLERELKLSIPLSQQAALQTTVEQLSGAQQHHLAAQYFDTPDRELALQGAALRLRLENGQWVQTLKMRGTDVLSNQEYNHPRPQDRLDLSVYEGTPAAALFTRLRGVLKKRYQTDVRRTTALIEHPEATIELALDLGHIQAKQHRLSINELEFELVKGEMAAVFSTALQWQQQYELIMELRSKAERGDALYEGTLSHSDFSHIDEGTNGALQQIIRYAAFVINVDANPHSSQKQAQYLLGLRVAMRRLRSYQQLFAPWLSRKERQLAKELRHYYRAFGLWRDQQMLTHELQPKLQQAGLPLPPTAAPQFAHPADIAASLGFQRLLLQLLALQLEQGATPQPEITTLLEQRLNQWLQRIQQHSKRFEELDETAQHRLRNRIKRLRYSLELLSHNSTNHTDPLLHALSKAQHQLGELCDCYVAQDHYPESDTASMAWLQQRVTKKHAASEKALKKLLNCPPIVLPQTH